MQRFTVSVHPVASSRRSSDWNGGGSGPAPRGRDRSHFVCAFTLVELLVVIGIIALMIGILLPVLSKAQSFVREKTCASNLRQIGQALFIYANANKGFFPLEPTEQNPHLDLMRLIQVELRCDHRIFYCPQSENMDGFASNPKYTPVGGADSVAETSENIAAGNISYIYWSFAVNKQTSGGTYWRNPEFVPRQLKIGGVMPVAATGARGKPLLKSPAGDRWLASDFYRQGAPFPHTRRHAQGLNVLHMDGRVELIVGSPKDNYR